MATPEGGGNATMAMVALAFLVGIFGVLAFLAMRMTGGEEKEEKEDKKAAPKKRGALDRMKSGAGARAAAAAVGEEEEDDDDDDEADGRAGRRSAKKDAQKQEKKEQAAAARQQRQDQDAGKVDKNAKYGEKQAAKEAERLRAEEQERQAAEEKEKKEKEEFDKWKDMFKVDAEGEDDAGTRDESAIERFLDYVKIRKVVGLEDLAAEFKMKTTAVIDRLEQFEKLGRLSGIFDDRGKYIYITEEEMKGVAEWMQRKGRIGRADLVAACNRIIRLNPTDEDKAKLHQEAKSAAASLEEEEEAATVAET